MTVEGYRNHLRAAAKSLHHMGVAAGLRVSVRDLARKQCRLVMTLLVRDEEDIVKQNIDFHLDHGVDFIIATDNGSIDNTREILCQYQSRGVLHLIDEPAQDYSQEAWVNRMGRLAYEQHGADIIFHCDADEFWYPGSGSLKNELLLRRGIDVLRVSVVNMLLCHITGRERFPFETKFAVVKPILSGNLQEDSQSRSFYLLYAQPKVIYRTRPGYLPVVQGNHSIQRVIAPQFTESFSQDIRIAHFPIRSEEHFTRKIINGGASYERNQAAGRDVGWHWRRWYEAWKDGRLHDEYLRLVLSERDVKDYLRQGIVCESPAILQRVAAYCQPASQKSGISAK